jgi:hypothetical protein
MRDWADVLEANAATPRRRGGSSAQLRACEAAAIAVLPAARALGQGDAQPATPGARRAAFRHAADRVETALAGLEAPLSATCSSSSPTGPRALVVRRPGAGELVEWRRCWSARASRAARTASAAVYLELAVLVRALQGLDDAARLDVGCRTAPRSGRALRPARHAARRDVDDLRASRSACAVAITVVGVVNLDLVVARRAAAASRGDRRRRDVRRVPGARGEPGVACARLGAT